jgi:RecB family exonuclease
VTAEGQTIREALNQIGPGWDMDTKYQTAMEALAALEARLAEAERAAEWEQEHGGCECRTCLAALPSESGTP